MDTAGDDGTSPRHSRSRRDRLFATASLIGTSAIGKDTEAALSHLQTIRTVSPARASLASTILIHE